VQLVAEAADGSMRDGLSLLDQLLAFGGGKVAETEARAMLATVDRRQVARLAALLAEGDPAALLDYARSLEEWAPDHGDVLDALATLLVRVALRQALPTYEGDDLHPSDLLADLASRIAPEDVQLYYQTAITGRRDLAWAPDPRTGFEMTLLRMIAFRPAGAGEAPATPGGRTQGAGAAGAASAASGAQSASPAGGAGGARVAPSRAGAGAGAAADLADWAGTVAQLELGGAARQLAAHCVVAEHSASLVRLELDPAQQLLRTPALVDKLGQALSRHLGRSLRVEVELAKAEVTTPARAEQAAADSQLDAARRSLDEDPTVRAFREKFGATLKPDSVRPN
jgi:DNA polymerase-3 subunit gamma/tau